MPKKTKGGKRPRTRKPKRRRGATQGKIQQVNPQHQYHAIHNTALKNSERDNAEIMRSAQAEEKELKISTLKLQQAVYSKKLNLL